jgi:hypothetical protein
MGNRRIVRRAATRALVVFATVAALPISLQMPGLIYTS